jgi:hypothetical protein
VIKQKLKENKFVPVYAIMTRGGCGGIAPIILNLTLVIPMYAPIHTRHTFQSNATILLFFKNTFK